MDRRLNLGNEVRELKLGSSFTTPKSRASFHTLKYDFKPASVDLSKTATLDVSSNSVVTVSMPHLETSGVPKTVFKGNRSNYTKECVLIIDKVTREITIEKLHHNIQVKKTRSETNHKSSPSSSTKFPLPQPNNNANANANANATTNTHGHGYGHGHGNANTHPNPNPNPYAHGSAHSNVNSTANTSLSVGGNAGPSSGAAATATASAIASTSATSRPSSLENNTQRVSNRTRVSTGIRKTGTFVQRHSPIQGSPSYPHHRSPQQAPAWNANNGQSTLPSIPIIGMDDDFLPTPTPTPPKSSMNNVHSSAGAPASNLDTSHQFKHHHSKKPTSKSSPKINQTPSSNQMAIPVGNIANHTNNYSKMSSSLQNNLYGRNIPVPRQSSSHHHSPKDDTNEIGVILSESSDSSDSSDSDSNSNSNSNSNSSDSESSDDDEDMNLPIPPPPPPPIQPNKPNVVVANNGTASQLYEDLHLSSNSSDSDD